MTWDLALNDTLLLYAPVPLHQDAQGGFFVESQALNGLQLWTRNFARVIVMMPLDPGPPPPGWVPVLPDDPRLDRVVFEALPMAFRPDQFLRHLPATQRRIRALIAEAQWLSFAIGGLFGDWGAVACLTAHRMGRPFAAWTDRVESQVVRQEIGTGHWRANLRARLTHRPMAMLERAIVRRAALGLFHGRETFEAYAPYARGPAEIVHDVHISAEDHIEADRLAAKAAEALTGPLQLVYAGRADPMKGPFDWIEVLERLAQKGIDFRARWLGDGTDRPAMLARLEASGLASRVEMPGFLVDRAAVLEELRDAHLFLFCHLTPESPRCLIEALASGCPLAGYASAYSTDLIAGHGGGALVPRGDTAALADQIAQLDANRTQLAQLILSAAADGAPFTDTAVFQQRSQVIRDHLGAR
ncbi:glycosyltransferase (plasmid) [Paracoccus liaowanqingii]|uniref:Glycosyltransferase n=1 Tax=Paracoccus liaowanqingii TaxID=2560053 RepID=A0A4Y5SV50_9RHOB|nr:glycosyltransferase [Paracoccus liaowanqingii]QDA36738.1 glycosyltransferase [Paracoccus liaowanqingii]